MAVVYLEKLHLTASLHPAQYSVYVCRFRVLKNWLNKSGNLAR